jgi:hypothetical protein
MPHLLLFHRGLGKSLCASRWHQLSHLETSLGNDHEVLERKFFKNDLNGSNISVTQEMGVVDDATAEFASTGYMQLGFEDIM